MRTNAVARCHFLKWINWKCRKLHITYACGRSSLLNSRKRSLKIKMYLDNCYSFPKKKNLALFLAVSWCVVFVCNKKKTKSGVSSSSTNAHIYRAIHTHTHTFAYVSIFKLCNVCAFWCHLFCWAHSKYTY